jgi:hypothetical protein
MKAAASRLRSTVDRCVRLFTFGIRRLHLGPILYDSHVRGGWRSWCPVALRRHSQMFELTLLLAPAEGAAS